MDPHRAPFFIIGPGRSGNTLLRRMLVEQTNACIPDEIYVIGDIIRLGKRKPAWNDFVHQSIQLLKGQQDGDLLAADFGALQNYLLGLPRKSQSVGSLISAFYAYECSSFRKENGVAGDKTPLNTFSALDLRKIYPDVKFVFMLRFPIDVVSSYVESGLYQSYEEAIDRVQRSYRVYKRIRSDRRVLPVCYEELVKQPSLTFDRVIRHLSLEKLETKFHADLSDVQRHEHHAAVSRPISTENIGKGLAALPQHAISSCADLSVQYFKFVKELDRC